MMRKILPFLLIAAACGPSPAPRPPPPRLEIQLVWEVKLPSTFGQEPPPSLDPINLDLRCVSGWPRFQLCWIDSKGTVLYERSLTDIVRQGREDLVRVSDLKGHAYLDDLRRHEWVTSKNFKSFALWTPLRGDRRPSALEVFRWDDAKRDYVLLWSKPWNEVPWGSEFGMQVSDNGYLLIKGSLPRRTPDSDPYLEGVAVLDPSGETIALLEEGDEFYGPLPFGQRFQKFAIDNRYPDIIELTGMTPDASTIAIGGRSNDQPPLTVPPSMLHPPARERQAVCRVLRPEDAAGSLQAPAVCTRARCAA